VGQGRRRGGRGLAPASPVNMQPPRPGCKRELEGSLRTRVPCSWRPLGPAPAPPPVPRPRPGRPRGARSALLLMNITPHEPPPVWNDAVCAGDGHQRAAPGAPCRTLRARSAWHRPRLQSCIFRMVCSPISQSRRDPGFGRLAAKSCGWCGAEAWRRACSAPSMHRCGCYLQLRLRRVSPASFVTPRRPLEGDHARSRSAYYIAQSLAQGRATSLNHDPQKLGNTWYGTI
jgi:hypothetical protein